MRLFDVGLDFGKWLKIYEIGSFVVCGVNCSRLCICRHVIA